MTPLSVKRKLSIVDSDIVEGGLPKKLRVQQINSAGETILNAETSSLASCDCKTKGDEEIGALKNELQLLKTRLACVEQESNRKSGTLSHVGSLTHCSICREVMRNPHTLECGHSACYRCLRRWWLTPCGNTLSDRDVDGIDSSTDDEEERGSRPPTTTSPILFREPFTSPTLYTHPQYPSLPHFKSVLHFSKQCPECRRIVTNQPVPNYRLRDIVDALRPSLLSPMTQMQRDRRWGRRDAWRGIFPSGGGDGMGIRSTQTQQAYVIPSDTQGHIQTPFLDSDPFHVHTRHGVDQHRTNRSQPYSISHPQRRDRRRWEPYDPVREALREMKEQRERQRRSRAPSPPVLRVRAHLNRELSPLESTLLSQPLDDGLSHLDIPRRSLERSRELGLETDAPVASSLAHQPQPPRPYLQQPTLFSRSLSRLNPQLQLPPIRELLSLPLLSDATLPPLLHDLPMAFEISQTAPHQHFPYSSLVLDNRVDSDDDDESGEEGNVQEKQGEESNENDDGAANSSLSQTDVDAWIGADLED